VRFNKKVAIVTGGGSGFGEGIALRLANEGAHVIVADVNERQAARVADNIILAGGRASPIYVDGGRCV
jgi:3-oxoacyl-[acyl-carrier protein] reductase